MSRCETNLYRYLRLRPLHSNIRIIITAFPSFNPSATRSTRYQASHSFPLSIYHIHTHCLDQLSISISFNPGCHHASSHILSPTTTSCRYELLRLSARGVLGIAGQEVQSSLPGRFPRPPYHTFRVPCQCKHLRQTCSSSSSFTSSSSRSPQLLVIRVHGFIRTHQPTKHCHVLQTGQVSSSSSFPPPRITFVR